MRPIHYSAVILFFFTLSCVSTGKYKAVQQEEMKYDSLYSWAMHTLKGCQDDNAQLNKDKRTLKDQANDMKVQLTAVQDNNTVLHKELADLSAISSAQAESIKKSLDNIGAKDLYLQRLRTAISRRDSVNLAVLLELKAAMGSFSSQDVGMKVERGAVKVDVINTILFGEDSAGYTVSDRGKTFLIRLARVLNDVPDVRCTVEVNTDSTSAAQDSVMDSWELSARRAASIVRILQQRYDVAPVRMTAAGRGEYLSVAPVAPVTTVDSTGAAPAGLPASPAASGGQQVPSRTRFVIVPPGDELLDLLERRS